MAQKGYVEEYELIIKTKDGQKAIVLETARAVRDDDGNVVMYRGTMRDITGQRQLEQQLLQSQKMEAIGRLAGGIAHDFNNALTVVIGNTDLILTSLPKDSPYRSQTLNIRKAADHATGLTRQLLAFSRRQIISPRILSINKVISDLHGMLQRVIGEDVRLVTHLGENVGNTRIDPGQIEQVLMNLVVNARESMPEGGIIAVETEQVELDEAYVNTHPYVKPGLYVQISVSDTGVGMGDEVREKVFEPFFTTKEGGTGFGLSTVYGIVKQNEGSINIYSEEGIGTTFKIYFSVTKERADAGPTGVGKADLLTGSETILVVEDDDALRDLAVEILTGLGYRVHAFSDAEEALFSVRESEETIDLLLTDVVMPGLSGVELANAVLEADPSVRVLYMSGYTDNAIAYHGVLDEGVNLLQKPFSLTEIAKKVREVLDA